MFVRTVSGARSFLDMADDSPSLEQVSDIAMDGAAGQNVAESGEAGTASGGERNGSRAGDCSEVEPSAGSSGFSYSRWDKVW